MNGNQDESVKPSREDSSSIHENRNLTTSEPESSEELAENLSAADSGLQKPEGQDE